MKKLKIPGSIILLILVLFYMDSCSPGKTTAFIRPPIKDLNIPYSFNSIDPSKDTVLTFQNGTRIEIPAYSLVDNDNKPVTAPVQISYREMRNSAQILISGIPMEVDSGGKTMNLTTAGMFQINGSSEGKPVFVGQGKNLKIDLSSDVNGNYNFYRFDSSSGKWVVLANAVPPVNTQAVQLPDSSVFKKENAINSPVKPRKAGKKSIILDFKIDYNDFPELRDFHEVIWEYLPEMNALKNAKDLAWIYDKNWSDIRLEVFDKEKGYYKVKLGSGNDHFEAIIAPVLSGKEYSLAMNRYEQKMKSYNQSLNDKITESSRIQTEIQFLRQCSILDFGLYNWDCIYQRPDMITFNARFIISKRPRLNLQNYTVYHITSNNKSLIKYYVSKSNEMAFSPSDVNKLIIILPNDEIAIFTEEQFEQLKIRDNQEVYTLDLDVRSKKIKSPEDLEELL